MGWRLAADAVLLLHLAFILFAVFGAWLALRWRWVLWAQLPACAWAVGIMASGRICPLTPLENRLRGLAGQQGYEGGFIEHYLMAVIYPQGLTREVQVGLGLIVLLSNGLAWWAVSRSRSKAFSEPSRTGRTGASSSVISQPPP